MPDSDETQDRLGVVLRGLRKRLDEIDDDRGGALELTREQCSALRDCIDLVRAVRLISVDYR